MKNQSSSSSTRFVGDQSSSSSSGVDYRGVAVATAAFASKYAIRVWQVFKARPPATRMRKFYEGGFQPSMTRRDGLRSFQRVRRITDFPIL